MEIFELSTDDGATWKQVTKQRWVEAERACGFHGYRATEPATAGFSASYAGGLLVMRGRIRRQLP